jgi:hypothetical protein
MVRMFPRISLLGIPPAPEKAAGAICRIHRDRCPVCSVGERFQQPIQKEVSR